MPLRRSIPPHIDTDDSASPPTTPVAIVTVACEQDLSRLEQLTSDLHATLETRRPVIVDLSQTTLIDSISVSTILRTADRARTHDQPFTICAPTGTLPRQILSLLGVSNRAHVAETIEHALAQAFSAV